MGNSGGLTWVRLQQLQERCYPFPTMCAGFLCIQTKIWLPMLWTFNVHKAQGDCLWGLTDTVRGSVLKVDSRRKILCRTRESNLLQRCASPMLYQLSFIPSHVPVVVSSLVLVIIPPFNSDCRKKKSGRIWHIFPPDITSLFGGASTVLPFELHGSYSVCLWCLIPQNGIY